MTEYLEPEIAVAAAAHLGFHIRDEGLLFSALARPASSAFGTDAYPELELKAAALMHSLARNHPLFDGNERFAWYLTLAFLGINGRRVVMTTDTAFDLVLGVARGETELADAPAILRDHLVPREPA